MAKTYYVDQISGSDNNSGVSASSAFATIAQLNKIVLLAGDTVLLAKGSVFTDTLVISKSGTAVNPITVSSYGEGEPPTFAGELGIRGSKSNYVNLDGVAFKGTAANAIYAGNATNWNISNVSLEGTGTVSGIGGIVFKGSSNISITHSTFDNVTGDGIFVDRIDGITVSDNSFTNIKGPSADGVQINASKNVAVSSNYIDVSTSLDSTKGGVVVNESDYVNVSDNTVIGGSFGLSINSNHVVIEGNTLSGHDKYTWSASILIGGGWNLTDYKIIDNSFNDSRYGIALTGLRTDDVTRTDFDISGNTFSNMEKAALKLDKPSTGSFHDNVVIGSEVSLVKGEGFGGAYAIANNSVMAVAPIGGGGGETPPVIQLPTPVTPPPTTVELPANPVDHTPPPADPAPTPVVPAPTPVEPAPTPVDHTPVDPAPTPVEPAPLPVDPAPTPVEPAPPPVIPAPLPVEPAPTPVVPAPPPVVPAPTPVDPAPAPVVPAPPPVVLVLTPVPSAPAVPKVNTAPIVLDDRFVFGAAAHDIRGNILANDIDADGNMLMLRSVGTTKVAGAVDLQGKFGTLHIDVSGAFTYTLDDHFSFAGLTAKTAVEKFSYKVSDGTAQDSGALLIDLASHIPIDHTLIVL